MLNALYNEKILNFAAHIGQTERLTAPDATVTHHSPLCGSRIPVAVSLGPDGRIAGYGQQVSAFALRPAAAAVLGEEVVDRKSVREGKSVSVSVSPGGRRYQ